MKLKIELLDLEDALDELKAEFEKMMSADNGEEAPEEALEPVIPAQEHTTRIV